MLPNQHAYIGTWKFYPHLLVHQLLYFHLTRYNGKMITTQTIFFCIPCTVHCKIRLTRERFIAVALCVESSGILVILPSFSRHKLVSTIF